MSHNMGAIFRKALFRFRVDADECFNQGPEQRVSALADIVNKLKKTDINRQALLRNATTLTQPTP